GQGQRPHRRRLHERAHGCRGEEPPACARDAVPGLRRTKHDGEDVVDGEGLAAPEVQGPRLQSLPALRPSARILPALPHVPALSPRPRPQGADPRSHESELVAAMMSDPIADLLTRIRNANKARKASVDIPWSRPKEAIARVLVDEGYLGSVAVVDAEPQNVLRIDLRYDSQRRPVISGVRRVSRPSLRVYVGMDKIPAVRGGLGINVLSTPKGVLVDRDARREKVGGEVICTVW